MNAGQSPKVFSKLGEECSLWFEPAFEGENLVEISVTGLERILQSIAEL